MKRADILSPPVSALIFTLGPLPALLGLDRGNEARTAQSGQVCGMPVILVCGKGFNRRVAAVVAECTGDGIQERSLAVGTNTIKEEQSMLARVASKGIAGDAL